MEFTFRERKKENITRVSGYGVKRLLHLKSRCGFSGSDLLQFSFRWTTQFRLLSVFKIQIDFMPFSLMPFLCSFQTFKITLPYMISSKLSRNSLRNLRAVAAHQPSLTFVTWAVRIWRLHIQCLFLVEFQHDFMHAKYFWSVKLSIFTSGTNGGLMVLSTQEG